VRFNLTQFLKPSINTLAIQIIEDEYKLRLEGCKDHFLGVWLL